MDVLASAQVNREVQLWHLCVALAVTADDDRVVRDHSPFFATSRRLGSQRVLGNWGGRFASHGMDQLSPD